MPPRTESEITDWVKQHKSEIINQVLDGFTPSENPTAIFMAGLPGAGKTEFLNHIIIYRDNFIIIDLDNLVTKIEGYQPEDYYLYRKSGNILVSALLDKVLKKNYSFALDGTFAHPQALKNVERALKHQFEVDLFFVTQSPQTCWNNTQARRLITGRPISRSGFLDTCTKIIPNLQNVIKKFENNSKFFFQIMQRESANKYISIDNHKKVDEFLIKLYNEYKEEL